MPARRRCRYLPGGLTAAKVGGPMPVLFRRPRSFRCDRLRVCPRIKSQRGRLDIWNGHKFLASFRSV